MCSSVRDIQVVSPHLLAALREHKARQAQQRLLLGQAWHDNNLVFPTGVGSPINSNNLTRDYDRWMAKAGVPRIHDQRHTQA